MEGLNPDQLNYIKKIYYDKSHPGGFSSASGLKKAIDSEGLHKISLKCIKNWLASQEAYTSFKQPVLNFDKPRVVAYDKNYQWDVDTLNLYFYEKWNSGYKYILICLDISTHFLVTRPLKTLKGEGVKDSFVDIFKFNQKPQKIRSDRGTEFRNSIVKGYFQHLGIDHFTALNTRTKANYAERVIRTIRQRLGRIFKGSRNFNWVGGLQAITAAYNNTVHRSIGTTPLKALCEVDKTTLWKYQYLGNDAKTGGAVKYSLPYGGRVKLSYLESKFTRTYDERWTREYFIIIERGINQGYETYKIKDTNNDIIEGTFYPQELQLIALEKNELDIEYDIEKILKYRTRNNIREALVKWLGYRDNFNTWIPETDITNFEA